MLTWTPIRFEDGDVHYEAEPSRNWRLSVGRSLVDGTPCPGDSIRWCVQERSAATGRFIDAEHGDSASIQAGQLAAENSLQRLQRSRGRPLKGDKPTTGTERSKQRMDRLMATEAAAGEQRQQLTGLSQELAEEGLPDLAGRVAEISRITALKAVAEYTRRNSQFFVRNGPKMLSLEETSQRRAQIMALANKFDMLAARLGLDSVEYQHFEEILRELQKSGFYPDSSLVSAVAYAFVPASEPPPLTRAERLRRVAIVCCNFSRNLAFYRVGWSERWKPLLLDESQPQVSFWRQANSNFLDICVLEWCKLFGDRKGEHYWGKIASDAASFEARLLQTVGMDADTFQREIDAMRVYRNKFVAHLDSERVMNIPHLDVAQKAVWFYYEHIVVREAKPGDFASFAANTLEKFTQGYEQSVEEAQAVYLKATKPEGSDRGGVI